MNEHLFDSQQARRILDRLVGYKISPILWKSVKRGISAGRVQSVALKLLVEREKERRAFVPQEYWLFKALFEGETPPPFKADLFKIKGKSLKIAPVGSQKEADALQAELDAASFIVQNIEEKKRSRRALPPYITSTLQQDANNRLGYSAKRTMSTAQRLYEGVELGNRGLTALITYMRTDSVRIAEEAQNAAKEIILSQYGKEFYPAKPNVYKTKGSAQDAHEAIRPVDVSILPEEIKSYLPKEQFNLYRLIWQRFVASQMAPAQFHATVVDVAAGSTLWRTKGERLLFPGYLAALEKVTAEDTVELPKLKKGQKLKVNQLSKEQKFTQAPARYSEASLVKELEEKGIGRPSTYAAIISTLQDREYVSLKEKRFVPSELGFVVSDQLSENFKDLMDVSFTASMEDKLDKVADGRLAWQQLMQDFADGFYPTLESALQNMRSMQRETGVTCELCGQPMLVKFSKAGEFLGCSGYPSCKNIKNFKRNEKGEIQIIERAEQEDSGLACEKCGKPLLVKKSTRGEFLGCSGYPACKNIKNFKRDEQGAIQIIETPPQEIVGTCPDCGHDLVIKRSRAGARFIACSNYPKCKNTKAFSLGIACPAEACDGQIVEKGSRSGKLFYSCSNYPKCDFALWNEPVETPCPECGHPILVRKNTKAKGPHLSCPQKSCSYELPLDD